MTASMAYSSILNRRFPGFYLVRLAVLLLFAAVFCLANAGDSSAALQRLKNSEEPLKDAHTSVSAHLEKYMVYPNQIARDELSLDAIFGSFSTQDMMDEFFCNSTRMSSDCRKGKDCIFSNQFNCTSYVKCIAKPHSKTGTVEAYFCASGEEYSVDKRDCAPAGAPGTCSANHQTLSLEPLESVGLLPASIQHELDMFYCNNTEISKGCQGPTDCVFTAPDACGGYIKCTTNPDGKTGTAHMRFCNPGDEYSIDARSCQPGLSGRCSVEQTHHFHGAAELPAVLERLDNANTSDFDTATIFPPSYQTFLDLIFCNNTEISTGCKGQSDCQFPVFFDATSYVKCTINADGKTATAHVKFCGEGGEYNADKKLCQSVRTRPLSETNELMQQIQHPGKNILDVWASSKPQRPWINADEHWAEMLARQSPVDKYFCRNDDLKTGCESPTECVYAFPGACNVYIKCKANENRRLGTAWRMECKDGEEFSTTMRQCLKAGSSGTCSEHHRR